MAARVVLAARGAVVPLQAPMAQAVMAGMAALVVQALTARTAPMV
jgi:hypothetical protein